MVNVNNQPRPLFLEDSKVKPWVNPRNAALLHLFPSSTKQLLTPQQQTLGNSSTNNPGFYSRIFYSSPDNKMGK